MKKSFVRVLSLALIAVMMVCALASCSKKISGSYGGEIEFLGQSYEVTYTFSGKKVNVERKATVLGTVNTTEYEGTYEIVENDDGKMEITFEFENGDDSVKSGTYTFEEGDDYIKIGVITYTKKD